MHSPARNTNPMKHEPKHEPACQWCGYNLTGHIDAHEIVPGKVFTIKCPECGEMAVWPRVVAPVIQRRYPSLGKLLALFFGLMLLMLIASALMGLLLF
jgi:hypothetical protein